MRIDQEKLLELDEEYHVGFTALMNYYEYLKNIPCVQMGGVEKFEMCLETLIQNRISASVRSGEEVVFDPDGFRYSASDALYRTYEDAAIPFLSSEFKRERGLSIDTQTEEEMTL